MDLDDDDMPRLPADTLRLLQDFQTDKENQAKQFEKLRSEAEDKFEHGEISMDLFGEASFDNVVLLYHIYRTDLSSRTGTHRNSGTRMRLQQL